MGAIAKEEGRLANIMAIKLLKEPLVHFLAGAALIFIYFWAIGSNNDPSTYEVNITESDIARITNDANNTSTYVLTADDIKLLVDDTVKEEIYYREALRLGLDKDDTVIRRRLSNKMKNLNNDDFKQPSDAQLQKWMDDNPEIYGAPYIYEFEHIYIGRNTSADMQKKWLKQLRDNSLEPKAIAQPLSVPRNQKGDERDIEHIFGIIFVFELAELKTGDWQGPIESGFGMHFIKITDKKKDVAPSLAIIRQEVENDWYAAQTSKSEEAAYNDLKKQYDIKIAPIK